MPNGKKGNFVVDAFVAELSHRMGFIDEPTRKAELVAYPQARDASINDMMRTCLQLAGNKEAITDSRQLIGRALTTSDFPLILSGVANKAMASAYQYAPGTFQLWMAEGSLNDFKTAYLERLTPPGELPEIGEDEEFKLLSVVEGEAIARLKTYGGILAFTRQAMVNDNLGALKDRGRILGITTKTTQNRLAYRYLLSNPVLSDGVQLFHTSRSNYQEGANTALSRDSMAVALKSMRMMQDGNGNALSPEPKFLLVPPSLEVTAHELCFSDSMPGQNNSTVPNMFKKIGITPIVEPLLESPSFAGSSAITWYLLPDPKIWPVFTALALGEVGKYAPYLDSQTQFKNDNLENKVRTDFGVAATGWQAVKMKGAV